MFCFMRRLQFFIIILVVALASIVALAAASWYMASTTPSYYGSSWMGQMWGGMGGDWGMGGMMGDGYYGNSQGATSPSYLWIIPVALLSVAIISIVGVAFYFAYPELKYIRGTSCAPQKTEPLPTQNASAINATPTVSSDVSSVSAVSPDPTITDSCKVLLKTMTPEEQKVLNVLINHKGKYLQKYVSKEAGLSRLKTHRVIARFAQRNIVAVKEFGNTNEIILSNWVRGLRDPTS